MADESKSNVLTQKKELILGDDFENALSEAAAVKNTTISMCKERNKNNYSQFYDIMLGSRVDIQELMTKKGKSRTPEDNNKIKNFKKETSQTYRQVCDLIAEECAEVEDDDGKEHQTKIQKIVTKIATVAAMMRYIGKTGLEDEFAKYGIKLQFDNLEVKNDMFSQEHIKKVLTEVFESGKTIKEDIDKNNASIKTEIYGSSVPIDLQYDKKMNPTGIKASDFCKLVDLKAKLLKAVDDTSKEKVKETVQNVAGEYVFQNARNTIINNKLMEISV